MIKYIQNEELTHQRSSNWYPPTLACCGERAGGTSGGRPRAVAVVGEETGAVEAAVEKRLRPLVAVAE